MKRRPFDEVCSCEFENETHRCVCTRKKGQAKMCCQSCADGKHKLEKKEPSGIKTDKTYEDPIQFGLCSTHR